MHAHICTQRGHHKISDVVFTLVAENRICLDSKPAFELGWLARELSRSSWLLPSMLGSQGSEAVPGFSCEYWRHELRFQCFPK